VWLRPRFPWVSGEFFSLHVTQILFCLPHVLIRPLYKIVLLLVFSFEKRHHPPFPAHKDYSSSLGDVLSPTQLPGFFLPRFFLLSCSRSSLVCLISTCPPHPCRSATAPPSSDSLFKTASSWDAGEPPVFFGMFLLKLMAPMGLSVLRKAVESKWIIPRCITLSQTAVTHVCTTRLLPAPVSFSSHCKQACDTHCESGMPHHYKTFDYRSIQSSDVLIFFLPLHPASPSICMDRP